MVLFRYFKTKIVLAVLIGILAELYYNESKEEYQLTKKEVLLTKSKSTVFDFVSDLDFYSKVIIYTKQ